MHDHAAAGFGHRGEDGGHVQRFQAGHVDHFGGYALFGQLLGGLQGFQHRGAPADQGDVAAFAQGEGRAQRQGFAVVSDRFFQQPVQPGGLQKNHRVGVADGGQQQAVGAGG